MAFDEILPRPGQVRDLRVPLDESVRGVQERAAELFFPVAAPRVDQSARPFIREVRGTGGLRARVGPGLNIAVIDDFNRIAVGTAHHAVDARRQIEAVLGLESRLRDGGWAREIHPEAVVSVDVLGPVLAECRARQQKDRHEGQ